MKFCVVAAFVQFAMFRCVGNRATHTRVGKRVQFAIKVVGVCGGFVLSGVAVDGVYNAMAMQRGTRLKAEQISRMLWQGYGRSRTARMMGMSYEGLLRITKTPEYQDIDAEVRRRVIDSMDAVLERRTDVAIRIGALKDSTLHSKPVGRSRVRILASSGKTRSRFAPDVPTFREQGYDIEGSSWYAAFAPARTPAAMIDKLSAAMAAAVRQPDVVERLHALGLVPTGTTAAELAAIQKADSERWAAAVKLSKATIISIPGVGHVVAPQSPCAQTVITSFLADPGTPDTSCVGTLPPPTFTSSTQ